jgi:hypothetical protein
VFVAHETQSVQPSAETACMLFEALLARGQISLRKGRRLEQPSCRPGPSHYLIWPLEPVTRPAEMTAIGILHQFRDVTL